MEREKQLYYWIIISFFFKERKFSLWTSSSTLKNFRLEVLRWFCNIELLRENRNQFTGNRYRMKCIFSLFFLFYNEFKLYESYLRIIRKIKIIIYTGISLTRTMLKAAWNIDIDRLVQARVKESPGMSNGPVE